MPRTLMRMRSSTLLSLPLALSLATACGGEPAPDTTPDGPPPIDAPIDAPDLTVVESRSVTIGPVTVAPGGEATVCGVVDLGNLEPRMVRAVHSQLSDGTHHVIATVTPDAPRPGLSPCGPFAGGASDRGILTIAQQPRATLGYPTGAGLPVVAHQSVHLEMHYFNPTEGTLAISGTITLDLAAADAGLSPVALLFTGGTSLNIPARGTQTVSTEHPLPPGAALFATTAHTHQWGTLATVELLDAPGDPTPQLLHSSTNWAERPLDQFPPITVGADARLRLTCNYDNRSDSAVGFGLSAEDEMCFVWAHHVVP